MSSDSNDRSTYNLFLDSNVLFSASSHPKGKAFVLIGLARAGKVRLSTSLYAVEEARRNLIIKRPQSVASLEALLRAVTLTQHHPALVFPPSLPEKDQPIFQAALACGATHLITGDLKDFGKLMDRRSETFGVHIQTPAKFLGDFESSIA